MERGSRRSQMGPYLMATGKKAVLSARECASIPMAPSTQEVGLTDSHMAWALRSSPMERSTPETGPRARPTGRALKSFQTERNMMAYGKTASSCRVAANTPTGKPTMASGSTESLMDSGSRLGLTGENTMETGTLGNRSAKGEKYTLMAEPRTATGKKESSSKEVRISFHLYFPCS